MTIRIFKVSILQALFFTDRQRIGRKVMFSQVSVLQSFCLQWEGVGTWHASWDRSHVRVHPSPSPCYWHLVIITGDLLKLIHLRAYPLPVLTSSGGQWNKYVWQAGGTHPTGMLSCLYRIARIIPCLNNELRTSQCKKENETYPLNCLQVFPSVQNIPP